MLTFYFKFCFWRYFNTPIPYEKKKKKKKNHISSVFHASDSSVKIYRLSTIQCKILFDTVSIIVYAPINLRDREKHGSESITDPQCNIDRLWITSSSFHKKAIIYLDYWQNNRASDNETFGALTISTLSEVMLGRPDRLNMVWNGLPGMVLLMEWPGGHGMVYGIT